MPPEVNTTNLVVNEGELLSLKCTNAKNIPSTTTLLWLDPEGEVISETAGNIETQIYMTIAARSMSGMYECEVSSNQDSSSLRVGVVVVVQCEFNLPVEL